MVNFAPFVLELQVPRIFPKHANLLKMHKAVYGFTKTRMLVFTHLKEVQDFGPQIIATGQVPKKIFIAVSTEQHYLGDYKKNRFTFNAYNVENVLVRYQSAEFPYRAGYRMSYAGEHPNYIDAWLGMYTELGQLENPSFNITWEDYEKGMRSTLLSRTLPTTCFKATVSTFSTWNSEATILNRSAIVRWRRG